MGSGERETGSETYSAPSAVCSHGMLSGTIRSSAMLISAPRAEADVRIWAHMLCEVARKQCTGHQKSVRAADGEAGGRTLPDICTHNPMMGAPNQPPAPAPTHG